MSRKDGDWDEDPEYDFDPDVEDYERYDDEEEGGRDRRRTLMLLSVVALLVVFAGVVFLAYRQGNQSGVNGAPPILRADGEPTKELPENPGGKKFPHQDAGVYNRIAGDGQTARGDSEQLLPPAEEPLAIDNSAVSPSDQRAMDRMAQAIETAPLEPAGEGARVEDVAPVEEAPPAGEVAPAGPAPVVTDGGYVVQLAAFRDEAAAREAFGKLQSKYPDLLGPLGIDIQRADLGDKGIYYRLRAGYVEKAAADALCGRLEEKGQGCLVRPR